MKLILFAIALFANLGSAQASALACKFQQRTNDFYSQNLPAEVVGWVNCPSSATKMNVITVSRMPKTDQKHVLEWFKGYESVVAVAVNQTRVLEKTQGSKTDPAWMEIESKRELGSLTHFVFAAPSAQDEFVFIYTDTDERAREVRGNIKLLSRILTSADYLQAIAKASP